MRSTFTLLLLASGCWPVVPPAAASENEAKPIQRIAFGSCANQSKPQPIWDVVVEQKPDIFVFLGDNIYADTADMKLMKEKYARLGAKPGYQQLLKQCPVLATWDDHDFGVNDGGAWYPKKEESQRILLDFFNVPQDSPRRQRPGIYDATILGPAGKRVQIILLDTRYFRSRATVDVRSEAEKRKQNLVGWYVPNHDPAATMLGPEQWKWLEARLREPADLRFIASSSQVVADEKGMESWGNFPAERTRLYQLIKSTAAQHVLFLSGDVHFAEISKTDEGPYPLYDFTSSGLTNVNPSWAAAVNTHRVTPGAYAKPNAGFIDIDWDKAPPQHTLRVAGLNQESGFSKVIRLSELEAAHEGTKP